MYENPERLSVLVLFNKNKSNITYRSVYIFRQKEPAKLMV